MKNKLMKKSGSIISVLDEKKDKILVIDCINKTMPVWYDKAFISDYESCPEEALVFTVREIDSL